MKRLCLFLILIIIMIGLIACGDKTVDNNKITKELAFEGVNNYCHSEYDWSVAENNPEIMYVEMGEETEKEYLVIYHAYTGALVHFYVDKTNGITKVIEFVPSLDIQNEAGTIDIHDYLN